MTSLTSPAPLTLPDADTTQEWVEARTREGLDEARRLVESLRTAPPADTLAALRHGTR